MCLKIIFLIKNFSFSALLLILAFSGERLPAKRTSVKMKNLNPEWNERFKLIVKDPQLQALELQVYDWDKVFLLIISFR